LKLALVQTRTVWHDPAANRARFDEWLGGVDADADLVVLPEMFATGFTMASAAVAETMDGPTVAWMQAHSRRRGQAVAGSLVISAAGNYYNRFICARPGEPLVCYDKRHRFRMAGEHQHYAAGARRAVFSLGEFRICPMVCYDLRFPVFFRNRGDYDLLLCVANWPAARERAWRTLLAARAIENQCYAVGVNVLGRDGNGVGYNGASLAIGPEGEVLLDSGNTPGAFSVTLDLDRLERYRAEFPAWRDADIFTMAGDTPELPLPEIDEEPT
jgi:predicted amidohydrolase